jgi:hypothetical protein
MTTGDYPERLPNPRRPDLPLDLPRGGGHDDELTDPDAVAAELIIPANLPADERGDDVVCGFCIRTVNRQRRHRLRAGVWLCGLCASQPQLDPKAVDYWLSRPREARRVAIILRFHRDPLDHADAETAVNWREFYADVDGSPLAVIDRPTSNAVGVVGMPRTFWHVLAERGPGALPGVL